MKAHDRFESLAGAIALGEATPEEREIFNAHAATCTACRDDASNERFVPAAIVGARDSEVWQPTLDRAILERVRERRASRTRVTIGALAWAAAASIAINMIFVTGFAGQLLGALAPQQPAQLVNFVRLPADTFAHVSPRRFAPRAALALRRPAHVHARATSLAALPPKRAAAAPALADRSLDEIGALLTFNASGTHRSVAVETSYGAAALQP